MITERSASSGPMRARGSRHDHGVAGAVERGVAFVVSVAVAGLLAFAIWKQFPDHLDIRTDIVGYPTFSGFDPRRNVWGYYLVVIVFPLAALAFYALVQRLWARFSGSSAWPSRRVPLPLGLTERPDDTDAARDIDTGWKLAATAVGRALGARGGDRARGLRGRGHASGHRRARGDGSDLPRRAHGHGLGARVGTGRPTRVLLDVVGARLNVLAVPLSILGLYAVSRAMCLTVVADGTVHHYGWLPLGVVLVGTAVGLVLVIRAQRVACTLHEARRVERTALLLVAGPLIVFLLVAYLPGAQGSMNVFEQGQWLGGGRLFLNGGFLYRDFVAIHGPLQDVLIPAMGLEVFQNSFWGMTAGMLCSRFPSTGSRCTT